MANLNEKICIIGGGPAGLAAGMYLEKAGYNNYTILEKNDHVGGKAHSPKFNHRRYEMGAIMGADTYYAVHECEIFGGTDHDGLYLDRKYQNKNGKEVDPFNPKKNLLKIPRLLKMKRQMKEFGTLLETKYKGYDVNGHRGVAEGRYDGYAATAERERMVGENPNLKDLTMPFKDFCKLNNVELVQDIWVGPYTSFGYGYFDEIPAAYVLKYLDFQTTVLFVAKKLWTWYQGTQSIWEGVDAHLKNPARLNSKITKVERKDNKVYVTVNGTVEEYDKLIVTAPLQFFPDYADATPEEKELFSKIDYERYDVLAYLTEEDKHPDITHYIFENMLPKRMGHCMIYYRRWIDAKDQPITTYALRKHKNTKEIPYDKCKHMVIKDVAKMGAPVKEIINEQSWYYFPHVFSEDYAAGWYDKVEAMQGQNNTYYAGEIMSFGDMEETCEYSCELVKRFF